MWVRVSTSTYSRVNTWARILRIVAFNKNLSGNKNQPNENRPWIKLRFAERYLIGARTSPRGAVPATFPRILSVGDRRGKNTLSSSRSFIKRSSASNYASVGSRLPCSSKLRDEPRERLPIVNLARHDWISQYCVSSRWGAGMRARTPGYGARGTGKAQG